MRRFASAKVVGALIVCFFISGVFGGCAKARKPLPEGNQKLQKEPVITLYINETGERKKIPMEEYLYGVVAAEMDTKWPVNALAAQAILARTFTMKQIKTKGGVPKYKADASTSVEEFQAYDPTRINDNVKKAVEMTRGEVITYNGQYVNAWFSACDGGETASAAEGLAFFKEKTPYIKAGVKDGCLNITVPENKNWTATFPAATVAAAVKETTGKDPGPLNAGNVKITKRGPSGRAETVKVGKVVVSGPALRLALGNDKMRSIYVNKFAMEGGNLVVSGKGYGHGVGMCQWGAKNLAQQGKKPEDIVRFFFRNVKVEKRWE